MGHTLNSLLRLMVEKNSSDLHIASGMPPSIRVDGHLQPVDDHKLTPEQAKAICFECLDDKLKRTFDNERSVDLSFGIEGLSRFRANVFWSIDTVAGAFRTIPYKIPRPEDIGLPPVVVEIADRPRGLVLVTGPTGSGKSTTLASIIQRINETRHDHLITVEDPIEYLYTPKNCVINQREVGKDTPNFQSALKYILRQDPDVVLIGEMRDLETIQNAITVAETGHLVFATLHTNTAAQTIDRIIDVFPPHQQEQIRVQLSFILEGILCQQLVPKIGGGRTLALEILMPTAAIRNLIREGKTHQIYSQMLIGQQDTGMVTLDQSLANLANVGIISKEDAERRSFNLEDFRKLLQI